MPNRLNPIHEATRLATWVLMSMGRELRIARYRAGLTQRAVGRAIGRSASWVSLVERGMIAGLSVLELARVAAAVGLKLYVNAYPMGRRPLDAPQVRLLTAFNARISPAWRRELEKVMPIAGDLRAVDELLSKDSCTCAVEAIARFASVEGQVRSARAKQRDLGATRLILLVQGGSANRRMLREAGPLLTEQFPIGTRQALRRLAAGEDPGGDCLIVL